MDERLRFNFILLEGHFLKFCLFDMLSWLDRISVPLLSYLRLFVAIIAGYEGRQQIRCLLKHVHHLFLLYNLFLFVILVRELEEF